MRSCICDVLPGGIVLLLLQVSREDVRTSAHLFLSRWLWEQLPRAVSPP